MDNQEVYTTPRPEKQDPQPYNGQVQLAHLLSPADRNKLIGAKW